MVKEPDVPEAGPVVPSKEIPGTITPLTKVMEAPWHKRKLGSDSHITSAHTRQLGLRPLMNISRSKLPTPQSLGNQGHTQEPSRTDSQEKLIENLKPAW